jgi:hypothetical protein
MPAKAGIQVWQQRRAGDPDRDVIVAKAGIQV